MCNKNCCTKQTYHAIMIFSILSLLLWPNAPNINFMHPKHNQSKPHGSIKGGERVTSSSCTSSKTTLVMAFLYGAVFALVTIIVSNNYPSSSKHQASDSPRPTPTTSPRSMIVGQSSGHSGQEDAGADVVGGGRISRTILRTFPTFAYSVRRPPRMGKGAKVCAICQSKFRNGQMVRWLPECDHLFHLACIDEWLASHITCPCCRTELELVTGHDSTSDTATNDTYDYLLDDHRFSWLARFTDY